MPTTRQQLLEEMMFHLGDLNRLAATQRDTFLSPYKLSRPQIDLLFSIKHSRRTIGELAEIFSITPSAISQMVTQLENKKLVRRRRDKTDRRITYVELSVGAKDTLSQMRKAVLNRMDERFVDIGERELEQLNKLLTRITKRLGK